MAVFEHDGAEPALSKWLSDDCDLRDDAETNQKILELLQGSKVERIYMLDRIFGCPHETGVDYPADENCPHCPFWANRDRVTGKKYD